MAIFRKSYLLALLMISMPILVYIAKPTEKIADAKEKINLEQAIPLQFADWKTDTNNVGLVTAPNGGTIYDQVLTRTYVNSQGQRIMLAIAYGSQQTHDLKVHQQEVCYKAQGFNIQQLLHSSMNLKQADGPIPITQMFATRKDHNEQVTYWFTIGNSVITGRADRFVTILKYMFSGFIADGYLIRVANVTLVPSDNAYVEHQKFIEEMMTAMPEQTSHRLLGKL